MFALVDCNNFYASCERVFRPDLAAVPILVLSNNDGCVIARSNEAKAIGFEMGEPYHLIRDKIESAGVRVFSSNYTLYGDLSRRVSETIARFAPEMEQYSIDEAFLRFSSEVDWMKIGAEIRRTVRKHTGIPVSVGFAPSKVLAKAANRIAKRTPACEGVFVMPTGEAKHELLKSLPTKDLWGIGSRLSARLEAIGVKNAYDLMLLPEETARRVLTVVGARIVLELQGHSCLSIEEIVPAKKEIICSRSFGRAITNLDEMREAVATYISRAGEKLRRQGSVASSLHVFIETNPFAEGVRQYFGSQGMELTTPTNFTPELLAAAGACLDHCWRDGHRYKKAGVMVMGIHPEKEFQSTFTTPEPVVVDRQRRAMKAVDQLNRLFGRGTVSLAAAGIAPPWQMRRARCSARYTTRWEELPVVVC